jgi:hypothetical protein
MGLRGEETGGLRVKLKNMPYQKEYKINRIRRNDNDVYVCLTYWQCDVNEEKKMFNRIKKIGEERKRFSPQLSDDEIRIEINKDFSLKNTFEPIEKQKYAKDIR